MNNGLAEKYRHDHRIIQEMLDYIRAHEDKFDEDAVDALYDIAETNWDEQHSDERDEVESAMGIYESEYAGIFRDRVFRGMEEQYG